MPSHDPAAQNSEPLPSATGSAASRERAIEASADTFDALVDLLRARVARRTESQGGGHRDRALAYLTEEIAPQLEDLGFSWRIGENPVSANHPAIIGRRVEFPQLPTVLVYGHGDVQFGHAQDWSEGRSPWHLSIEGDALYGRGSADNKGQHTVDLCALGAVIGVRGKLGYNVTVLIEMGEEAGSVGLTEIVREHVGDLAADLFIGSDGPRLDAQVPTLFLGSRGALGFELALEERSGDLHSGNWGGRVRNPATVLAAAIGAFVDGDGVIRADFLRPPRIPDAVRRAVQALPEPADDGGPTVDPDWGEPGLSPNERVFAWNTVEVLALEAGDPAEPKNAIPARARAVMQLRYVVGTDVSDFAAKAERVLRERGIRGVAVRAYDPVPATRLDPDAPVVRAAEASIAETVGRKPAVEPNLGGTIPNAVFADQLDLPTVWIPHSHPGSNQHAPDEHALASVLREGLRIMAGVFWDMGERPEQWFGTDTDRPGARG